MIKPPKRFLVYLRPHVGVLALIFAAGIVASATIPATLMQIKPLLDQFATEKRIDVVGSICVNLLLIFGIGGFARFSCQFLLFRLAEQVMMKIRNQLYKQYTRLSMNFYVNTHTGMLISRATNDVQMLYHGLTRIEPLVKEPIMFVGLLGYAIYLDWQLTLYSILILPVVALIVVRIGKGVRRQSARTQQQFGLLSGIMTESFVGIRIIKAFRLESMMLRRFRRENNTLFRAATRSAFFEALSSPLIEFLVVIVGVFLLSFLTGRLVSKTAGELVSIAGALGLLRQPLKGISQVNVALQRAWAGAERIFEILDLKPDVVECEHPVVLAPFEKEIKFDRVSFDYGDQSVLQDINVTIKKGETVALVGSSGGGKSTLLNLLPRFYDATGGVIKIDGVDIKTTTAKSLRGQISYVSQEVFLFHDTIEQNIAFGDVDAPVDRIVEAAKIANAHDFILSLSKGYETVVGDRGIRLSGGERQRISVARAILKDAPILILDEATSALDSESEKVVQEALDRLMKGRTTLVVAHRLSTIQRADRILVLEGGRIVEEGTHNSLMVKRGAYARFYNLQNSVGSRGSLPKEEPKEDAGEI